MGTLGKVVIGSLLASVGTMSALTAIGESVRSDFEAQSGSSQNQKEQSEAPTPVSEPRDVSPVVAAALKKSPKAKQIAACKIALALMNDRDVTTFSGESAGLDTVQVEWRSPDDGRRWQAVCEKTGKSSLRWAAYNAFGDGQQGRWRTEDTIRMKVDGDRITVSVKQPGWPEKSGSYRLDELS